MAGISEDIARESPAGEWTLPRRRCRPLAGRDLAAHLLDYTEFMAGRRNPYDWQSHQPKVEIPRGEVGRIAEELAGGGSAVVLGGRGMGKSVFLRQLRRALEEDAETRVVVISAPPPELTVRACLDQLAHHLQVPLGAFNCQTIVDGYFDRDDVPERLILLFDEFDRYAERRSTSSNPPGRGFFNDLEATRRDTPPLAVMATGSLGVFVVRDVLGSSFLSRAYHTHLSPFDRDHADILGQPFVDRGQALAPEILDALHLATGGIPALLTYGLQRLWLFERSVVERDVLDVFAGFRRSHAEYLRDLLKSVADPRLSEAPQRVLEEIRQADAPLPRARLEDALAPAESALDLDVIDVLRLLEAAGLVRVDGSLHSDDPLRTRPIPSLLDLPARSAQASTLVTRLRRDLERLLAKLHRASVDFYRGRGETRQLVPESVFAAHLALGLDLLGWRTEREAQSVAGRTDLKLRRNGSSEVLLVEVKIWGRNDYRQAQRQIEGYWAHDVSAGIVIQLSDAEVPDWGERYRRECLEPLGIEAEADEVTGSPIDARFATITSVAGMTASVDHYLVTLPKRR